ncbi:hypothetical protein [Streptomyces sp. NPDC050704]|uniref:hypothetical protein n=1 Tax=Streptomyces sp. NPDC050704 TaxID=3157219 RepID=UPI003422FF90
MPENIHRTVTDVPHAKVRAVTERVVQELALAADKVAAHHAEPAKYPLPADRTAAEHLIARRFHSLPDDKKKRAAAAVVADLGTGPVRAKRLGDLARVDLRSPASVDAQVKRLGFPERLRFPAYELRRLPASLLSAEPAPRALAAVPTALHKLELRIRKVKCLDETAEWGSDEIHLAGSGVDASGDTLEIGRFRVRSFDDGDVKVYDPPRPFHWFYLTEGIAYPKSYFVTLVLAELDWGGLAEYVNALTDLVRKRVVDRLGAAIGGAIGASGGPVGVLIGMAVGAAVGRLFDRLKGLFGDDVFRPVTVGAVIPALTGRWSGRPMTAPAVADFRGFGGHYQLTYDWRMFD